MNAADPNLIAQQQLIAFNLGLLFLLKIVVFILGYLTIRLGYKLINDGVTGKFTFKANAGQFGSMLKSGSPGLLFVLLGIGLIGYGIFCDKRIPSKFQLEEGYQKEEKALQDTSSKKHHQAFDNKTSQKY